MTIAAPHISRRQHQFDNTTLTYTAMGAPEKETLCFIPGWGGHRRFWQYHTEVFSQQYFVLSIDFPGFGDSCISPISCADKQNTDDIASISKSISMEHLSQAVISVLNKEEVFDCTLVGHSIGGALALTVAAKEPTLVRSVVGADAFTYMDLYPKADERIKNRIITALEDDFDATVRSIAEGYFLEGSDQAMKADVINTMASADPRVATSILRSFLDWDMPQYLSLYQGAVDAISASVTLDKEVVENSIGSRLTVQPIDRVGHFIMMESPEEFTRALRGILER